MIKKHSIQLVDDSPAIYANYNPILRESLADVNLEDKTFFDHAQYMDAKASERNMYSKYYQKEAQYISQMNQVVQEGRDLMLNLYAFRNCGKAIPQVQSQSQENKLLIYEKTCETLRPGIYRMLGLMTFHDKLNACFTDVMTGIIPDIKDRELFPSETLLLTLADLLDLTISLDTMKNFKGSMSNDLSMYKRAKSMLAKDTSDPEIHVLPKLGFFLASKNQFSNGLKSQLATINTYYEDLFCDMINLCCDYIETDHFLQPNDKHIYIRAMAFAVYLIDGESDDLDFNKKKKFKVERLGKILRSTSIVPLFGDIAISVGSILVRAPHWSNAKFDLDRKQPETISELRKTYLLTNNAADDASEFSYIMTCLKKTEMSLFYNSTFEQTSQQDCSSAYSILFTSIKFLSRLTNRVLEQAAWKYLNPKTSSAGSNEDHQKVLTAIYEQAVQFNYDFEEKKALLQYISMIKTLSGLLQKLEGKFQVLANKHMYWTLQNFGISNVTEYYNAALKKKKNTAVFLKNVRDALVDTEYEKNNAYMRSNPISHNQLFFVRSLLDFMFNEKSKGMKGGLMKEKNFKENQVADLQKFFSDSFHYAAMMNLKKTISECSDLSNLWFKEFYLELTKQVQFPISTSLPWILAEFALDSHETNVIQDVFVPLDLYNEAAFKTLFKLKSRYIYNEIEAEVNLCFDQFMFKLGKNMFVHYKKLAAIKNLDPEHKQSFASDCVLSGLRTDAYESILKQKSINLLGNSINVNKILSQIVNQYLRHSIDVAISRFEARSFPFILELESLIETARITHQLFSKYLNLENFDDMLNEIDECIVPGENNGRILSHTVRESIKDIVSNFCFNSTTDVFLRGDVFYSEPVERQKFPHSRVMYLYGAKGLCAEFASKNEKYTDFIGKKHFNSFLRLSGSSGFAVLTAELMAHITLIMKHGLETFLNRITDLSPDFVQYPPENDTLPVLLSYLEQGHQKLISFKALYSEILQGFREIGNSISLIKLLEEIMHVEVSKDKLLIQDIISYDAEVPCYLNKFEAAGSQLDSPDSPYGYSEWISMYKKVIRQSATKSLVMRKMLKRMSQCLTDISQFKEPEDITNGKSFAKAWSSLSFVASLPQVSGERTIRELFGDGLPIAGSALMFIFGQSYISNVININRYIYALSKTDNEKQNPGNQSQKTVKLLKNADWFSSTEQEVFLMLRTIKNKN